MKIILSPTKSMKRKTLNLKSTSPQFYEESEVLRNQLKSYSKEALKNLYKASDKVVETSYLYFHEEKDSIQALALYDGLVFKQLELESYTEAELLYLENHVNIMSALYGVLRVSDMIIEYRLDYLMKFEIDLYAYWNDVLTDYFKEDDLIVNLASTEFSTAFSHPNLVNIHFVNQEKKTQSTAAKMARGNMLNYLVKEQIVDLEKIKDYNNLNYRYHEEWSNDIDLYFVLEEA